MKITYLEMFLFITLIWVLIRGICYIKTKKFIPLRELQLLLVYGCIIIVSRFVYFPLSGGTLNYDPDLIFPLQVNLRPFEFLLERYDGWQINIIGNILMFVPVGIVWPCCYKKLNTVLKAFAACVGYTLFIEVTQLFLYERHSDVDDIILNSIGGLLGALIYFFVKRIKRKSAK